MHPELHVATRCSAPFSERSIELVGPFGLTIYYLDSQTDSSSDTGSECSMDELSDGPSGETLRPSCLGIALSADDCSSP